MSNYDASGKATHSWSAEEAILFQTCMAEVEEKVPDYFSFLPTVQQSLVTYACRAVQASEKPRPLI